MMLLLINVRNVLKTASVAPQLLALYVKPAIYMMGIRRSAFLVLKIVIPAKQRTLVLMTTAIALAILALSTLEKVLKLVNPA